MSLNIISDAGGKTLTVMELDGCLYPVFEAKNLKGVGTFRARPDDVLICTYPKSGTHWMNEIIRFLLAGTTDLPLMEDSPGFIERCSADDTEALPSPRSLITHYRYECLSPEVFSKKVKIVYMTRDPRDVAVSFFHHHIKIPSYNYSDGEWKNYFHLHLTGLVDYGSWFTYTKGWEQAIRDNPNLPVFVTSYEALQKDTLGEVRKLATFLKQKFDDEFLKTVIEKCSFESMRSSEASIVQEIFYRKGKVGDWKNWFTITQSEIFNEAFEKEMLGTDAYQLYSHALN